MSSHRMDLAVVAEALSNDSREVARVARLSGFSGVQFGVSAGGLLLELSDSGRREFRHMLTSRDQRLVSLRVDLGAKGLGPKADIDRALSLLDGAMDLAVGLGCPVVCVELGPLPPSDQPPPPKPKVSPEQAGLIILPSMASDATPEQSPAAPARDTAFESSVDTALVEAGRSADRYGLSVAFRSDLAPLSSLDRALRTARCPWFGVDFDPVAVLRDEWDVDAAFSSLGHLIRHVRARDAIAGQDRRTKPAPIGRGNTRWDALLAALDEAGYHGSLTIDSLELPDRQASAVAGLKHIRLHDV